MARGVRGSATLLPVFSPNLQPTALASYDPKTRRNTILIAEIVPTINLSETTGQGLWIPADRYYVLPGVGYSSVALPAWTNTVIGSPTLQNWDSTGNRFYVRIGAVGAERICGSQVYLIWPEGPFGAATSYAPKNASASAVWLKFTARFNANADYTTYGMGAVKTGSGGGYFSQSTDYFIQVLRNSGSWELGTCDGSTISQQSGGAADGNFHEFWVKWTASEVTLYVDGVATITKTTNLPTRPLVAVIGDVADATNSIDVVDYLIEWEVA